MVTQLFMIQIFLNLMLMQETKRNNMKLQEHFIDHHGQLHQENLSIVKIGLNMKDVIILHKDQLIIQTNGMCIIKLMSEVIR